KIVGSLTTDGIVEVHGQIDGEMNCASIIVSSTGHVVGTLNAEDVVVDGRLDGPIQGGEVTLKTNAHVLGDIRCQTIIIEKGAFMEGRLIRARGANGIQTEVEETRKVEVVREDAEKLANAENSTRKAELVVEARHLSGNPNLLADEALVYLAKRGNAQAKAILNEQRESGEKRKTAKA
ncbi:MAG: bactofilin family protein, partial [Methyloceanibacter sp.]